MVFRGEPRPIRDDDDTIRRAVEDAAVGALLPAVAQFTGDHSLLRADLRPDPANIFDPEAGLLPEQVAEAKRLAADALIAYRDAGGEPRLHPTDAELLELMAFVVGEDNEDEYFELLCEELGAGGEDRRAPEWHKGDIAPDVDFTVAVIGAGMSGLAAAHRLKQAGVDVVVLEKNDDVGGTWFENTYPGCRVDVPNHLYSYSFAQSFWPEHFSSQDKLLEYFRSCADELDLRANIRFGTEVLDASYDEDAAVWRLHLTPTDVVDDGAAAPTVLLLTANAVISAVGQLNRPKLPDIKGRDEFAGPSFHSAQWDHELSLTGQRVAVIGTGASAAQFIPIIADDVAELTVFQRTPNWLIPSPDYHEPIPDGMRWLLDHVPSYGPWYRLWLFWRTHEGLLPAAVVDPEWSGEGSVSELNEMVRLLLVDYLQTEFAGHDDLLAQVVPTYPPIAKRILRDNGVWARTLTRDHVHLRSDAIDRITPTGVVTVDADGQETEHEVDVIIYGTGFDASHFLTPMRVTGRGGADLHERWSGDARAYLGITIPDFPNLFCLYGPNTNIVINGSIIYFSELEVRYVLGCLRLLFEGGHRALDVRPEVHDAFNERIDAANRTMAWGASSVNSWYKNDVGRVAQNWPFSLLDYWHQARRPDPADYELL